MSMFEDYLAGRPLNKSNAALMAGNDPDRALPTATPPAEGELTRQDREWLRRLQLEPGWPLMMQLIRKSIQKRQESVTVLSQNNPLANKDEIAQGWANLAAMKQALEEMLMMMEIEIARIGGDEHDEP